MAIITDSELQIRLNHTNNAAKGRTIGAREIPDKLRELIGFQAHFETAADVAKSFGVSPISAHLAKESRGHEEVKDRIDERLGVVKEKAISAMLVSFGVLSEEKLKKQSIGRATKTIESMARVIEKTSEKLVNPNINPIIIYAPQVRQESDYSNAIEVEKVG